MRKKAMIELISFFIIACLIFQLIPSTLTYVESFQNHTQNFKVFLSSTSNTGVLYISRENQKTSIQKVHIKNASIGIHQIFVVGISLIKFSFQEEPFDHRKVIRQSIPQYFNGGKYKNNHFII